MISGPLIRTRVDGFVLTAKTRSDFVGRVEHVLMTSIVQKPLMSERKRLLSSFELGHFVSGQLIPEIWRQSSRSMLEKTLHCIHKLTLSSLEDCFELVLN
jgi:hypothetical protein